MIINQLDKNTRIKFSWNLKYLDFAYTLQRKRKLLFFNYWKTVSWTYWGFPNSEVLKEFLFWSEEDSKLKKTIR